MKKILFTAAVLLGFATGVQAQYSDHYYHRVGDTIEGRSEIGYYTWWDFDRYYANNMQLVPYLRDYFMLGSPIGVFKDSVEIVVRFYTPNPLRVVGLAGSSTRGYGPWSCFGIDTGNWENYYVIYDAQPDSFPLLGRLKWSPFDPTRTLHLSVHYMDTTPIPNDTSCCISSTQHFFSPIREYYFDSAITVQDSFYVGMTFYGEDINGYHSTYGLRSSWLMIEAYKPGVPCHETQVASEGRCLIDPLTYKARYGFKDRLDYPPQPYRTFADSPWVYFTQQSYGVPVIYPIIEVDTTVPLATACDSVANVQAAVSGTSATVTWDGFPFYSQLSIRYGLGNTPSSQWTTLDATGSTMYLLTDLQPRSRYGVSIQATCDTNKITTPWSAPVYFFTGTDTTGSGSDTTGHGSEGIGDTPTALASLTYLIPNPASDEVSVASSFNLLGIDIWTLDGVMVYHGDASGHDVRLDVSWLRQGSYIMAIHTHNGTTHKRLLIAR